jgi:flagellar FliL protein
MKEGLQEVCQVSILYLLYSALLHPYPNPLNYNFTQPKGVLMASKETAEKDETSEDVVPLDDGGKKGKNKKKIVIVAIAIVFLFVGSAGAYFSGMLDKLLGKDAPATEEHAEGEHGDKPKDEHAKDEPKLDEHGKPIEVAFLKIPDMIVNLNTEGGSGKYLRLSVQLELESAADMAAVEKVLPRVVDQFQTYLRELRVQDLRGSKGIYRLQLELLNRVNQAAAPTVVKDVLFQEILIQ